MLQCCECRQDIRHSAIRCHYCTAIQGWHRWIKIPLIICGFSLTIVSIWAADPTKQILDPKVAHIQPSIIAGDHSGITVALSNNGTRPATLVELQITSKGDSGLPSSWYLRSDFDGKILEPSKSYIIDASNGGMIPGFIDRFRSGILKEKYGFSENCYLLIDYIDMNGQERILSYPFMCDPIDIASRPEFKSNP